MTHAFAHEAWVQISCMMEQSVENFLKLNFQSEEKVRKI